MEIKDFMDKVAAHPELNGVGVGVEDGQGIFVVEKTMGVLKTMKTKIGASAVRTHTWEELLPVMLGLKEPDPIDHMTRVVGYYSTLKNWNASKIREGDDRRQGNYDLPNAKVQATA